MGNMNLLLTSIGRRGLIVKYFKRELEKAGGGKVFTTDCDKTAPAIHLSDGFFLTPRVTEDNYIPTLIEICKDHSIAGILSFIDPELEILAKNKDRFNEIGVRILIPNENFVKICYDKYLTHNFLEKHGSCCGCPHYFYEKGKKLLASRQGLPRRRSLHIPNQKERHIGPHGQPDQYELRSPAIPGVQILG